MREKFKCLKLQKKVKTKKPQPEETTLVLFFFLLPNLLIYLHVCLYHFHIGSSEARRGLDYLELELQIGTSYCVGAGN